MAYELPFRNGDLVEIASSKFEKTYKLAYGSCGRIQRVGPKVSNIVFRDSEPAIGVDNLLLRLPRKYRDSSEYLPKRGKNTLKILFKTGTNKFGPLHLAKGSITKKINKDWKV